MKKLILFFIHLFKASKDNGLFSLANELSYKLLLSIFPFIIFLMSLIGFFDIDSSLYLEQFAGVFPDSIYNLIKVFALEVVDVKNPGVLSLSLFLSIFSASSGFLAVMRGINKSYGQKESRNFIFSRLISILLVIIFAAGVILSISSLVFRDIIYEMVTKNFGRTNITDLIFGFFGYLSTMLILLLAIILIYRFANSKKVSFVSVIPGALITLIVWVIASKLFNIYINNFSKYSVIYGSIGSIFILMYWINIISVILLVGGMVNALLDGDPNTP